MNSEINISFSWNLQDLQNDILFLEKWLAVHGRLQYWKKRKRQLLCVGIVALGMCLYALSLIPFTPQPFMFGLNGICMFLVMLLLLIFVFLEMLSLLIPSWTRWAAERMAAVNMFTLKKFNKKMMKKLEDAWIAKFGDGQAIRLDLKLNEEKIEVVCYRTSDEAGFFLGCVNSEERLQYCRMDHCIALKNAGTSDSGNVSSEGDPFVMIVNLQRLQPQEQEQFVAFLTSSPWCEHTEDILKDVLKRKSHRKSHR